MSLPSRVTVPGPLDGYSFALSSRDVFLLREHCLFPGYHSRHILDEPDPVLDSRVSLVVPIFIFLTSMVLFLRIFAGPFSLGDDTFSLVP